MNPSDLPDSEIIAAVNELAASLDMFGVSYALIGGLATGLRSRPRATRDVDILLALPQVQLPAVMEDLIARGFTLDEPKIIEDYVQHHLAFFHFHGVRIDWLKPLLPLYQHVLDRAEIVEGFGRPIRVASSEGLILIKLIAAREQDWADISALLAANQGHLDLEWIEKEWVTLFSRAHGRWQRFRATVAEYYERGPKQES